MVINICITAVNVFKLKHNFGFRCCVYVECIYADLDLRVLKLEIMQISACGRILFISQRFDLRKPILDAEKQAVSHLKK